MSHFDDMPPRHAPAWPIYGSFVQSKLKSGAAILAQMTSEKAHLVHMAIGVSSDAGELLDAVKRWTIYGKELDRANVVEELGDIEFFLEGLRSAAFITREETLVANMAKLDIRYREGYTDAEAAARADKA